MTKSISFSTAHVLFDVARERRRQDAKWGQQNHPDGTGPGVYWQFYDYPAAELAGIIRRATQEAFAQGKGTWRDILNEEVAEAFAEDDPAKLRAELIQVAAVAAAWVEAIDRRAVIVRVGHDRSNADGAI